MKPVRIKKHDNLFTIIIIGGSQGAKIFDELLNKSFVSIAKQVSIKIIHQTSEKNINFLKNFYSQNNIESRVFSFDHNLNEVLKQGRFMHNKSRCIKFS